MKIRKLSLTFFVDDVALDFTALSLEDAELKL